MILDLAGFWKVFSCWLLLPVGSILLANIGLFVSCFVYFFLLPVFSIYVIITLSFTSLSRMFTNQGFVLRFRPLAPFVFHPIRFSFLCVFSFSFLSLPYRLSRSSRLCPNGTSSLKGGCGYVWFCNRFYLRLSFFNMETK